MTYQEIVSQLKQKQWARERKNRHDLICDLTGSQYDDLFHFFEMEITHQIRDRIKDFIDDYMTCVRYIQMAQKDDSELRGEDYNDGKKLQEEKVLSLGYAVGAKEFNKQAKLL